MSYLEFVVFIVSLTIIFIDISIHYKQYLSHKELKAKYSILQDVCKPTVEQEIKMLDIYRMLYYTNNYITYDYYKYFCIMNNIYLDNKYDCYFTEFYQKYPDIKEKYKDYFDKINMNK